MKDWSIRGVSYDSKQVQKQVQDVQVYVNGRYVSIIQSVSALSSTNHQLHVENQVHPEYYHAQERVNQLKLSVEESKEAENNDWKAQHEQIRPITCEVLFSFP